VTNGSRGRVDNGDKDKWGNWRLRKVNMVGKTCEGNHLDLKRKRGKKHIKGKG